MFKFTVLCALGFLLLGCSATPKVSPATPTALRTTEGVFLGVEEGDYFHWNMRTNGGEEVSYFVLRPQASVEKVLKNPSAFIGRKCRVEWKATTEDIPEAGGETALEQIVSVEWLSPLN